mmetsp:Transcript_35797/g.101306  ORF Transcript_35797/g.101306 Transcript_35797/m.101306 type:complete len:236 (-) Transcript_35797:1767-2474(-)
MSPHSTGSHPRVPSCCPPEWVPPCLSKLQGLQAFQKRSHQMTGRPLGSAGELLLGPRPRPRCWIRCRRVGGWTMQARTPVSRPLGRKGRPAQRFCQPFAKVVRGLRPAAPEAERRACAGCGSSDLPQGCHHTAGAEAAPARTSPVEGRRRGRAAFRGKTAMLPCQSCAFRAPVPGTRHGAAQRSMVRGQEPFRHALRSRRCECNAGGEATCPGRLTRERAPGETRLDPRCGSGGS